jgi:hypothetical protein
MTRSLLSLSKSGFVSPAVVKEFEASSHSSTSISLLVSRTVCISSDSLQTVLCNTRISDIRKNRTMSLKYNIVDAYIFDL